MDEPKRARRKPLGMIVAAVMAVGAIWAGVGLAADSGSGPASTPSPPSQTGVYAPAAAQSGADDPNCPNMGGSGSGSDNNGGSSTTPSTSDGSSNSGL